MTVDSNKYFGKMVSLLFDAIPVVMDTFNDSLFYFCFDTVPKIRWISLSLPGSTIS